MACLGRRLKLSCAIRWQPAFKQLIYRNDAGKLIVTISQNSIGNAITELLGVAVNRIQDAEAYAKHEPALIARLLEVRRRLIEADLGEGNVDLLVIPAKAGIQCLYLTGFPPSRERRNRIN